ncbi:MAG: thioredoxin TrxC [Desulfarculaceae bacterium]|jgi:thioredoxin 2
MSDIFQVVCPACQAVNRVDRQKIGARPTCGKCRAPLLEGRPVNLGGAGLQRHLAKSDLPLLVDFWAPWCGPCRSMAPAFEQAAARLSPGVRLAKVNTQEEQALAGQLGIQAIPTMVLFKNGREAARTSGAMAADSIVSWAQQNL